MIAALTLGFLLQIEVAPKDREDFAYLQRQGILLGYSDQVHHQYRPIYREEGTKIILGCYDKWFEYHREIQRDRRTLSLAKIPSPATEKAHGNLEWFLDTSPRTPQTIFRLVTAYSPDIRLQDPKRDISEMLRRLTFAEREVRSLRIPNFGESYRRFSDVPYGHWAEDAVHNLRREGVMWGYPDGTFNGKR